jgi:dihydrofolate synthase/folylpolyglutamate synthase
MSYGLSKIKNFLSSIGNPQNQLKTIHVAGTNGKGSTSVFIYNIMQASGYKVALYTSPHLINITERIKINDINIPQNIFNSISTTFLNKARKYDLSYFEYLTAIALIYFVKQKVDIAIIETGIGGRLDATNVIQTPMICVITSIAKDHQNILGTTITNIAFEKAGIIQANSDVICGAISKQILPIFYKCAKNKLYVYNIDFKTINHDYQYNSQLDQYSQKFDYININHNVKIQQLETIMLGQHQIINASTAICATHLLNKKGYYISEKHIRNGIKKTKWHGRFDIINIQINNSKVRLIIDGAHNPHGLNAFFNTFKQLHLEIEKRIFIFAVMKDKEYKIMINITVPFAKEVILPRIRNTRAIEPNILKIEFSKYMAQNNICIADSIHTSLNIKNYNNETVVIIGSLYLVGETLSYIYNSPFITIK